MARRGGPRDTTTTGAPVSAPLSIRLDRWLVHARVFKSRTIAAERISSGGIRVNGVPCRKPGHELRPGDVVTAAVPGGVRALRMLAPGLRRGPAAEAQQLYQDLDVADKPGDVIKTDHGNWA